MMATSMYHTVLRVAALTCALVLLFESGLVSPITKELSQSTHLYLMSAVGMTASVQPNELNQMTARLTQREQELAQREAALSEREINVGITDSAQSSDIPVYILSVLLFIILVLIVLNYALDYMRMKELTALQRHEQTS